MANAMLLPLYPLKETDVLSSGKADSSSLETQTFSTLEVHITVFAIPSSEVYV